MTSTPVSDVSSVFKSSAQGGMSRKTQVDFGLFINQATADSKDTSQAKVNTNAGSQDALELDKRKNESYNSIQDKISTKEVDKTKIEDLEKKGGEFQEKIKDSILESMNVSEEELEIAMEVLGLQFVDLIIPENLTNLVSKLTGNTEPVELLMSEEFQQLFQTIEELSASLVEDLGMKMEQIQELIRNLEQNILKESMLVEDETVLQEVIPQTNQVTEEENMDQGVKEAVVAVTSNPEESEIEVRSNSSNTQDADTKDKETQGGGATTEPKAIDAENLDMDTTDVVISEKNENQNLDILQSGITQGENRINVVETVAQTIENYQADVDAEQIMKQISEAIKVNISQESNSIELQLNPENLGKINLQVVEKSGVITTKIVTENETVKAALESQIVQLRENLDNQGLKVEAIEVTIASHEFERNLEENQQNGQQEDSRPGDGDRRRNLNLSDLADIQGIMSEEENLAVKMMLQNGNTVDYSA